MLTLNLKTAKHSEHSTLSAYHLNSDISYSQWPLYPKKIGNQQQAFYVITKNNGKNKYRDNINT